MIVRSLPTLGVEALLLSSAATLGCCILAWTLWRVSKNNTVQENAKKETSAEKEGNPAEKEGLQGFSLIRGLKVMKGSLIVVGFFVIGLLGGIEKMVPSWLLDGDVSFVALCGLLLFVGLGIGLNPEMKKEVRSLSPRMALLPVVTIIGSWLGALLIWTVLHRTLSDCMAINSGFAYYSLSSIFITEYRGAELGTIALLANIIREMLTLLGAPLIGPFVWSAGTYFCRRSTTMDTTLPILSQTVGQRYIALASIMVLWSTSPCPSSSAGGVWFNLKELAQMGKLKKLSKNTFYIRNMIKAALFDLDGVVLDTETQYSVFWGMIGKEYHPELPDFRPSHQGTDAGANLR